MLVLRDWRSTTASGVYSLWFASRIAFLTMLSWCHLLGNNLEGLDEREPLSASGSYGCLSVCLYPHVRACTCIYVHLYVDSHECWEARGRWCCPALSSLPCCLEAMSFWTWRKAGSQQTWLTPHLCPPQHWGYRHKTPNITLFMLILGIIWTQVLMVAR